MTRGKNRKFLIEKENLRILFNRFIFEKREIAKSLFFSFFSHFFLSFFFSPPPFFSKKLKKKIFTTFYNLQNISPKLHFLGERGSK